MLGSSVLAILIGAKELREFLSLLTNTECKVQVRRMDTWKDTNMKVGVKNMYEQVTNKRKLNILRNDRKVHA